MEFLGGALRKIMTTPYLIGRFDGYCLSVWKRNGVLFIQTRSHSSDEGFKNMKRMHQRFMYYGYKFETLCTGNDEENSSEKAEVDPNVCYNAVFKSKINGKRQDFFHSLVSVSFSLDYFMELRSMHLNEIEKEIRPSLS